MTDQPSALSPAAVRPFSRRAAAFVIVAVVSCAVYANLSFTVTNRATYRFFPPFVPGVNNNGIMNLGGEYFHIARALAAGQGYANPFGESTGPTAWQPPILPTVLAGVIWATDGNRACVAAVVVCLTVVALVWTGMLVLALAGQTTARFGTVVAVVGFVVALLYQFEHCFQRTHDAWLVLLSLDLLVAGLCWLRPLQPLPVGPSTYGCAAWGLFGGLCALASPVVGLSWGLLSVLAAARSRAWSRLALVGLVAALTLAPWTVRNYLAFGRLIPMKSNLALELYQSQCLQADGLLQSFQGHPGDANSPERREYRALGETAYLDRKGQQFRQAVWADPLDFCDRVASRCLAATLWYMPFNRTVEAKQPWGLWLKRLAHPLPFLALLVLVGTAPVLALHRVQWVVIGVYCLHLLPYMAASYYERYATPLLGIKVLLVVWAADRVWRVLSHHAARRATAKQANPGRST
jgi:hypothetical protein